MDQTRDDRVETETAALPLMVVLEPKLHPPARHPEHVSRTRLLQLLDAGVSRRLTLVGAPAGSGKSMLLAEWCRTEPVVGRVAWLSLDPQDSDPGVFWTYALHALRRVAPDRFGECLARLATPGVSLTRVVLPKLINELWTLDHPLTLVLDDYHTITNVECHESLSFFLRRLPQHVRLVIAARSDPPLELSRLRARGELCELRAADLCFVEDEAEGLLNGALGLGLDGEDVERLQARTEGWAAGLYLAALSLRARADADRSAFIADFAGDHRHLVAYLGSEVLNRLPEDTRAFLVQTSILERFSASLCDAVISGSGSTERLRTLEETNLFVMSLDQRGEWYRYHHLFRELLQLELQRTQPELLPLLHGRAAAWYHTAGDAIAAMHHALTANDYVLAGDLILAYAQPLTSAGYLTTLLAWMDALPEQTAVARPALAVTLPWIIGNTSRPHEEFERWLAIAEASGYEGPFALGEHSLRGAIALVRAAFPFDDVDRSLTAAHIAVDEETDPRTRSYLLARLALGECLYLAGRPDAAQAPLEAVLQAPLASRQSAGVIRAMANLALVSLALGNISRADDLARRAVRLCEEKALTSDPHIWLAYLAMSAVLTQQSRFDQAEAALATGVEPHLPALRRWPIPYARALLELVRVRIARGHRQAARTLLEEVRAVLEGCPDPGMFTAVLTVLDQQVQHAPRTGTDLREDLTESELRILRLLASDLNQREIARELYLSVNTVKSHIRMIYAKLGANSREAATIRARSLALIA
ncbi:MAG: LuxR C-terminal-related transcriptional regulator [Dehalococcoidia bacterium]